MNYLLSRLMGRIYMNEADAGEGSGAGGGAADRGDSVPDTAAVVDKKEEAAEDAAAAGDSEDKGDEEGRARDPDGKFAKKQGIMIPKARFDEVRTKAKDREAALTARIAALEAQAAKEVSSTTVSALDREVAELEDKYQALLDDGKSAEAKEIMRQIRQKERQIVTIETEHKSERARTQALEQFKFDSLVEKLEAEYPVLNPDNDEAYDQEAVDEVMMLRNGFEKSGLSPSAALAKAVKYVLGAAQKKEAAAEEGEKRGIATGGKKDERRAEQIKKNVDAANKQPSKMDKVGIDSDKKGAGLDATAANLTEEEFSALPASTKARMRGDFFSEEASS